MKIRYTRRHAALALGALALLGGSVVATPARAQDASAASDKPITLNLQNVPIQTALKLLFNAAGIRNYTIAPDVQGSANINSANVPFTIALTNLLNSVGAAFAVENGSYNVTIKRPTPPPAPIISSRPGGNTIVDGNQETTASTADQPKRFYPIPINRYDAYYISLLLGQLGLVRVDVNGVLPSEFGQTAGQNGQGGQGGLGGPASGISSVGGQGGRGGGGFGGGGGGYGGGGGFGGGRGGGGFGGGGAARSGGFAIINPAGSPATNTPAPSSPAPTPSATN